MSNNLWAFLVLLLVVVSTVSNFASGSNVCVNLDTEPDLRTIFGFDELVARNKALKSPRDALERIGQVVLDAVGSIKPAMRALFFSEGVFTVSDNISVGKSLHSEHHPLSGVVMRQRMSLIPETICLYAMTCTGRNCSSNLQYNNRILDNKLSIVSMIDLRSWCSSCFKWGQMSTAKRVQGQVWCESHPCAFTSQDQHCEVSVDPLSEVCMEAPAGGNVDITYAPVVRVIGGRRQQQHTVESPTAVPSVLSPLTILLDTFVNTVSSRLSVLSPHISATLSIVPIQPLALAMGMHLVHNYDSVAGSKLVHMLLAATLGSSLALVFVGSAYAVLFGLARFCFPVLGVLGPVMGLGPILLAVVPSLRNVASLGWEMHARLVELQEDLGIPLWVIIALISVVLSQFFDVFRAGSVARMYLRWALRLGGYVCLLHASSSMVVCAVLIVSALIGWDTLEWAVRYIILMSSGTDLEALHGSFLTREEFDRQGAIHTKKGLDALRAHLRSPSNENGEENLHRYRDLFVEAGHSDSANILERFAKGNYPGVPYTRSIAITRGLEVASPSSLSAPTKFSTPGGRNCNGEGRSGRTWMRLMTLVKLALICAILLVLIGVMVEFSYEDDRLAEEFR